MLDLLENKIRLAVERDVEKGGPLTTCNLLFDESGYFLLYATLLGIKVVNLWTNKLVRTIGKPENLRLLYFALFQEMNMFAKTFRFSIVSNLRFSNKRAVLDNFSLPNLVKSAILQYFINSQNLYTMAKQKIMFALLEKKRHIEEPVVDISIDKDNSGVTLVNLQVVNQ
ncbi:Peptidylprolyl isomerase domain and WD repeat-containing protein 1 [Armadillidium vulgare]|nr:Peptidylprolyl isomerase domain and WD repeat-containing protein 1 [Armadillidium vulgare]